MDVISIQGDLSRYRLVLASALFLINDELADNPKEFVKKGGDINCYLPFGSKELEQYPT